MALLSNSRASGFLYGPVGNVVKFGFVTDTHHDPLKAAATIQGGKYYQDAEEKIADIVTAFNARSDLSFVFENGDFIDGGASEAAGLTDIATITAALDAANVPVYHCLGNHEVTQLTKAQVIAETGQSAKWYSFVEGGVTFIVLDGNFTADSDSADLEVSDGTGASPFVSYVPATQRAWLADTLAASPYPCVIFCHYPLYYVGAQAWGLTNAAAVRTILEASGKVIGCIGGHLHDNYITTVNSIIYATLHATTVAAYPSISYSIVSVFPDLRHIKIEGVGYQMSYIAA